MLLENFFSREVLFIIGLTILFFEGNRLIIILNNKFFPIDQNLKLRIIVQYVCSIIGTVFIVSIILYYYFVYIEGFSTIQTELITFNAIYLLISIFYNLFFFSIVFANKKNETKVNQEQTKNKSLVMELESFKNQVNPDFLFQSLEIIISELYQNKKSADDLINDLSKTYRYTLDNKHNDLVSLKDEIDSLKPVCSIFKARFNNNMDLKVEVDKDKLQLNLIPGTLKLILEFAMSENIISDSLPLTISINAEENNQLVVQYPLNNKLVSKGSVNDRIKLMYKAYGYYAGGTVEKANIVEEDGNRKFNIPLLEIEEE